MANRVLKTILRALGITAAVLCLLPASARAQFTGAPVDRSTPLNLPATPTTDPALLFGTQPSIVLVQGDLLAIHIFGDTAYNPTVRVSPDGTILVPLISPLKVAGLSVQQAEQALSQALSDAGMYKDPQVNIQVTEAPNHFINVVGEVKMPGLVPAIGDRRLLDAVDVAGGLNPTASHTITILRPSLTQPLVVVLPVDATQAGTANIPLFAGDTVLVSRLGAFYVLGAAKTQGIFPLAPNAPTTLINAMSVAGGMLFESRQDEVRIIRTVGTTRKEERVNFARIVKGQDPDPILEADDVVYVPSNAVRSAIKAGGLGTIIALGSLATVVASVR
jgi:polysaccharide export outer membrane protein